MKASRLNQLFFVAILITTLSSCDKDDGDDNNILVGTSWEGSTPDDGIYNFITNTDYTFKDPGEPFFDGTYTFDGRNGTFYEIVSDSTFSFEIAGNIMLINYGSGSTREYRKN